MGYERNEYPGGRQSSGYGRQDTAGRQDYGRDDYGARDDNRGEYGRGDYGRGQFNRDDYRREYRGEQRDYRGDDGRDGGRGFVDRAGDELRSWFGDEEAERRRQRDAGLSGSRDDGREAYRPRGESRDYGRDRDRDRSGGGFVERAGAQVREWFGDDDDDRGARGRYDLDERGRDFGRAGLGAAAGAAAYGATRGSARDEHGYDNWRTRQIEALDRDYDEYRREHQSQFDNHFSNWRRNRQTQRDSLNQVQEHFEVVGSDGAHVGTVDKVRGDRIILTKKDVDAGGHHHSIPSSWLQSVGDNKVTLSKTADEAKRAWRDEEANEQRYGQQHDGIGRQTGGNTGSTPDASQGGALFGGSRSDSDMTSTTIREGSGSSEGPHMLNRSFSGTYDEK